MVTVKQGDRRRVNTITQRYKEQWLLVYRGMPGVMVTKIQGDTGTVATRIQGNTGTVVASIQGDTRNNGY